MDSDFFWPGPPVVQLRYNELADPDGDGNDGNDNVYTTGSNLYIQPPPPAPVPPGSGDFTTAQYDALIGNGEWHCAPTSFGMADSYWHDGGLAIHTTIHEWARRLDTDDINRENRPAGLDIRPGLNLPTNIDGVVHYGTLVPDNETGVESARPGAPWPGWYESTLHTGFAAAPTTAQKTPYWAEIRAGRPAKTGTGTHATLGVDFNPTTDQVSVHDPHTGATGTYDWNAVANVVTMQPHKLPDRTGGTVYFSNDNFGTGQANAQAPAGDAGDIFKGGGGQYSRVRDDNSADDYEDGAVTNGRDMMDYDAMDSLVSIEEVRYLLYSVDHGDPNPHGWIPGVAPGDPAYEPLETFLTPLTVGEPCFKAGVDPKVTYLPGGHGEQWFGLNYGEGGLPGDPLDDDIDALETEWDDNTFYYSVDFIDTRVFPELTPNAGLYWNDANGDPTDIYYTDGTTFLDGEAVLHLTDGTDLDAIQFVSRTISGLLDGLLFSVDELGDAPDARWQNPWNPMDEVLLSGDTLYLYWFDQPEDEPPRAIWRTPSGEDLDAITVAGRAVPEPAGLGAIDMALLALRRRRR